MANRTFTQFSYTLEKASVRLFAKVAIGSSGAPTLDTKIRKGIVSVTRVSAGLYTIALGSSATSTDKYFALLTSGVTYLGSAAPAAPVNSVKTDGTATGSLQVQFYNSAGTATDPASGETVIFEIVVSNSSAF